MLDMLTLLRGDPNQPVPITSKRAGIGSCKGYPEEVYQRSRRIMHWLLLWGVPMDCVNNAFLANGMKFSRADYLKQLHGNMRRAGNYKAVEKFYRSKKVKDMAKMGATKDELLVYYYGPGAKLHAQRRYHLKMLLAGKR